MSKIVIGAPVYNREWILPAYLASIKAQKWPKEDIGLVFVDGRSTDNTVSLIRDMESLGYWFVEVHQCPEWQTQFGGARAKDSPGRYGTLAYLRNMLLDYVTIGFPDYYLSWDTDVLMPSDALPRLIAHDKPAISPRVWMNRGRTVPNEMEWQGRMCWGDRKMVPPDVLHRAGAIMAVILMSRRAYLLSRYDWHPLSEDLAWADGMHRHRVEMWVDPTIRTEHFLSREDFREWRKSQSI